MARREIPVKARRPGTRVTAHAFAVGELRTKDHATSLKHADELVTLAQGNDAVLCDLVGALRDERAAVAERAANLLTKVQARSPRALDQYAKDLVKAALRCDVLRARWNLWLVLGRTKLSPRDRAVVIDKLYEALGSESAFERVHAMQALADLSRDDPTLRSRVRGLIETAMDDASAAVRARARLLSKDKSTGQCEVRKLPG